MIFKEKKCKGIGKASSVSGCGTLTKYRKYGLCSSCLSDFLFNSDAGKLIFNKISLKIKADNNKAFKSDLREKLKTLGDYKAEARKSFQKWIRLRDNNKPCVSCNSTTAELYDGGHFYKAEVYSGLIFNENNCHKQCRKCNRFMNGNELNYRKGLINRYGIDFVTELDNIADKNRVKKYTKEELITIKKQYDERIKEQRC